MRPMIDKIFPELSIRFQKTSPLTNEDISDRPFRILMLITRLSTTVALKSYEPFKTVTQSTVVMVGKMEASRPALRAAHQPGFEFLPPVEGPKTIGTAYAMSFQGFEWD
jgi:hypothetical protein